MASKAARNTGIVLLCVIVLFVLIYILTGFYVIQPLGMLPEGITVWYFRTGTGLPFITSPDGLSLERTGSLSLLSRMTAMSYLVEQTEEKIIARLPYSHSLYKVSTGGREFED